MGFLFAKILIIVFAAAILGAVLARWYFRRNHEDVTSDYARVQNDWMKLRVALEQHLAERQKFDLTPVQSHLERVESAIRAIAIPQPVATDLSPVINAINALPAPPTYDFQHLQSQVVEIHKAVLAIPVPPVVDFSDLQRKHAETQSQVGDVGRAVSAIRIPTPSPIDLSPVQTRLDGLEKAVTSIVIPAQKETDLSAVNANLQQLGDSVRAIRIPEMPPAQEIDLSGMQARLDALEAAVREIVIPPITQVDLQPVMQKLAEIEAYYAKAAAVKSDEPRVVPVSVVVSKSNGPSVRAGSRNLLSHAGFGKPDDLQQMKGVKGVMEKMLHDIGVYYFWQVAEWTDDDIHHADAQLTAFHGRIKRDDWVSQATGFAQEAGAAEKPAASIQAEANDAGHGTTEALSATS